MNYLVILPNANCIFFGFTASNNKLKVAGRKEYTVRHAPAIVSIYKVINPLFIQHSREVFNKWV